MNIIYIRTSTKEQEPENQLEDIKTFSPQDCVVFEEHKSAWKENVLRPEFNKVLKLIKEEKVKNLYCWDLDRLYRNRKRLVELFTLCKIYSVTIHSYNQKFLEKINLIPPPFNEIMHDFAVQLFGWMAEEESEKKSQRIKNSVKKIEGKKTVSYKGNKWGRKSISKQCYNKILALNKEGKSIRQIASLVKIYNKNNNSKNIGKSTVHKVLTENKTIEMYGVKK